MKTSEVLIRTGISATILGGVVSEVSASAQVNNIPQVNTQNLLEIPRGSGVLTYLRGAENDPKTGVEIGMMLYSDTPLDTAAKLAKGLDLVEPLPKYRGRIRVSAAYLTQDPGCDLNNVLNGCNIDVIRNELAITKAAGVIWHLPIIVKAMENGGAEGTTLTDPFAIPRTDNAYSLHTVPFEPREIDQWAFGHGLGHLLKLADAKIIPNSKTNVGRGYPNCTREPQFWTDLYGIIYSGIKGCESDTEAYTIKDIMDRPSIRGAKFAPELWTYIDRVMSRLPRGFGEPYGMRLPTPPAVFRLQTLGDEQLYRAAGLEFTLAPQAPNGTTCIELKVMPAANVLTGNPDGPGYNNILCGDAYKSVTFPKPEIGKGGYFLLPGMSYTWEYRVSTSPTFLKPPDNPGWKWNTFINPYIGQEYVKPTDTGKIIMPPRYSDKISLVSPRVGETVGPRSTVQWTNGDTDVFYYEVQVSRDKQFQTDPAKAIAAVYWNLVHGGETKPLNSWQIPEGYELEEGENWVRVRPRVQGDGKPVDWSQPASFNVFKTAINKQIYGWEPDADYGNGVIGPSKEDMKRWGKVVDYADSDLSVVKYGPNGEVTVFNP